jgi:hypothetical protein
MVPFSKLCRINNVLTLSIMKSMDNKWSKELVKCAIQDAADPEYFASFEWALTNDEVESLKHMVGWPYSTQSACVNATLLLQMF